MNRLRKSLPPIASLIPFESTARLGSLTRAAEELGLTQAAVSRQIRNMEEDLGTKLFDRRNRAVFLTKDGETLAEKISSGLESIASQAIQLRNGARNNEVVLFAQLCEGLYWVMPNLSGFYQQYPDIDVRVCVSTKPVTESDDYFDVALQTSSRRSGNCKLIFTAPDEIFPVCSPHYLGSADLPLKLSSLEDFRLLHHKAKPQDWVEWDEWLEQMDCGTRIGSRGSVYDSYPMMIQAAIEGHGIALGWKQTTERLIANNSLVRPFSESLKLPDGLAVYLSPDCNFRPEVDALLEWLNHELNQI